MGNGCGVSVSDLGGRWRVRWRETVVTDGVSRRVQREKVVSTHAAAVALQATILRTIEEGRIFEAEVREVIRPASVARIFAGWISARQTSGRVATSTLQTFVVRAARAMRVLRVLHCLGDDDPISASLLSRDVVLRMADHLRTAPRAPRKGTAVGKGKPRRGAAGRRGAAPSLGRGPISTDAINQTLTALLDAWDWALDDPATYPGVPPAPRDRTTLLPAPKTRVAPEAPTLAEVDAMIRRLRGNARVLAVLQRYTGLRIDQAVTLEVRDFDLDAATMHVRTGKTKREKLGRVVPIPKHLVAFLLPLVVGLEPEDRVGGRRSGHPNESFTNAWEEATRAGEVRRATWAPPGRAARPTHAIRAAYMTHLDESGTSSRILSQLVGHASGDAAEQLRGTAYVGARVERARAAVDSLPPIDWTGAST